MKTLLKLFLFTTAYWLLLPAHCFGQAPISSPLIQTNELDMMCATPPQVASVNTSIVGTPGNGTFFYWVVATYPEGNATPTGPALARNVPNILSASNFVRVTWNPMPRATSYDVLRTVTPNLPNGAATIALVTATTTTTFDDQGGALASYTISTLAPSVCGTWKTVTNPGAISARSYNNGCEADTQPGADGGAKIVACMAMLSSTTGFVDGRNLGNFTIGSTLTLSANAWVQLPCGTITLTPPAQIIMGRNSRLLGCGNDDVAPSTLIRGNHTAALITDGAGAFGWHIESLAIDNTSNSNVGGILISASGGQDRRVIQDVAGLNCETGFSLPNSTYVEIVRPKFGASCKTNISMGTATSAANSNFVFGGIMTGGQVGVDINGTGNIVIGTNMESFSVAAVRIGNTVQASNGNVIALRFVQANAADILIVNAGGNSTGNQIIGAGSATGAGVVGQMVLSPPSTAVIGGVNMNTTGVRSQKEWRVRNNGDVSLVLWDDTQAVGSKSWALESSLSNLAIKPYDGSIPTSLTFNRGSGNLTVGVGFFGDAGGFKHKRGTAGCATAASVGATCSTTITWTTPFGDANYTARCGGRLVTSGVPVNGDITAQGAASVTFQTVAATAVAAQFTNIDCVAAHD